MSSFEYFIQSLTPGIEDFEWNGIMLILLLGFAFVLTYRPRI